MHLLSLALKINDEENSNKSFRDGAGISCLRGNSETPRGQNENAPASDRKQGFVATDAGVMLCMEKHNFLLHERYGEFLITGWNFEHGDCRFFKNQIFESGDGLFVLGFYREEVVAFEKPDKVGGSVSADLISDLVFVGLVSFNHFGEKIGSFHFRGRFFTAGDGFDAHAWSHGEFHISFFFGVNILDQFLIHPDDQDHIGLRQGFHSLGAQGAREPHFGLGRAAFSCCHDVRRIADGRGKESQAEC